VFAAITEAAARVCHATGAVLRLVEGDSLRAVARYGRADPQRHAQEVVRIQVDWQGRVGSGAAVAGATRSDRQFTYLPNGEPRAFPNPEALPAGYVSVAVPLLKGGEALGALWA